MTIENQKNHTFVGKQVFPIGKSEPDHRTPLDLFESLGNFDLDVAASSENALCARYFDEEMNGLEQEWIGGRIWCNPPYSDCKSWVEKAIYECQVLKNCEEVVMLLPARTSVKWFKTLWESAVLLRFVHGRLNFTGPNMVQGRLPNAPFPSVIAHIHRWHVDGEPKVILVDRVGEKI